MAPTIIPSNKGCSRTMSTAAMAMGMAVENTPIVCEPMIQIRAATCRLEKISIHHEGQGLADVQPITNIRR